MSAILQPRKVEKPFLKRWFVATFQLFIRSPFRFGSMVGALGFLDTYVYNLAFQQEISSVWIGRVGTVALPIVFVIVVAIARGADDARLTRAAFVQLSRARVWIGALGVGLGATLLNWAVGSTMETVTDIVKTQTYLSSSGQLLDSVAGSQLLIFLFVGLCYFPILVLVPQASLMQAQSLSRQASELNGTPLMIVVIGVVSGAAAVFSSLVPAYGMTTAAFLVFMGTLNYVAYRDIFERKADNSPQMVVRAGLMSPLAPKV